MGHWWVVDPGWSRALRVTSNLGPRLRRLPLVSRANSPDETRWRDNIQERWVDGKQEVIGKLRLLDIQFLGIAGAVSKIYFQMVQCQLLRSESYISITRSSLQTRSLPRCLISSPPFPVPSANRLSTSCRYLRLEEKKVMKKTNIYRWTSLDVPANV